MNQNMLWLDALKFNERGLIPALAKPLRRRLAQDYQDGNDTYNLKNNTGLVELQSNAGLMLLQKGLKLHQRSRWLSRSLPYCAMYALQSS
ncbi:MAG: hypothetical protein HC852_09170 [Acaryochloridaceae cyanobacterium RU_4_10]|nr:hypothetical protein [Acaryochloridaceae cyanobacterium RU_4_10]